MDGVFASLSRTFAASILTVSIAALIVMLASDGNAQSDVNPPPQDIEAKLTEVLQVAAGDTVEIAPMVKKGSSTPGKWSGVPNGIFDHILGVAGILPGVSDPLKLKGHQGWLEEIRQSDVLNAGGVRATFGFFVRVNHIVQEFKVPVEYFVLMSYDQIKLKQTGKIINAFEFFLFGPIKRAGTITADLPDQPPLQLGLAIDNNGKLLPEVPLELAKVKNLLPSEPADMPVTPGVSIDGKGCLQCHNGGDEFPNTTLPFPWLVKPQAANETVPPPSAPAPSGTNSAPSNGQTGARPICLPNDAYCQSRAAEERERQEEIERRSDRRSPYGIPGMPDICNASGYVCAPIPGMGVTPGTGGFQLAPGRYGR
jgi:hypothetical protein